MDFQVQIADVSIACRGWPSVPTDWHKFLSSSEAPADTELIWHTQTEEYNGVYFYSPAGDHLFRKGESLLSVSRQWRRGEVYAPDYPQAQPLLVLFFTAYLAFHQGLLFHSSLVEYRDCGILFLGPSGIGKTTQARLWQQHLGAAILNGDLSFVTKQPEGYCGWGSPWHGSSPCYENASVRLRAMVILSQDSQTFLTRLSPGQALPGVMGQLFLPNWDSHAADTALETLNALMQAVPVYHLRCRADQEAVQILRAELSL